MHAASALAVLFPPLKSSTSATGGRQLPGARIVAQAVANLGGIALPEIHNGKAQRVLMVYPVDACYQ